MPAALSALLLTLLAAGTAAAQTPPAGDRPIAQLLSEQKWPEALAAIDALLKSRPNDTQLLMNRGAVLSNLNRNAEALATFQKVVGLNPQLPAAHNNMAVILAATGRYDEARAALERALKVQPNYATAYENLGDLYVHQAHESYRRALQIDRSLKSAKTKLDLSSELIVVATGAPPAERPAAAASGAAAGQPGPATPATPPAPAPAAVAALPARPGPPTATTPSATASPGPSTVTAAPPTPALPAAPSPTPATPATTASTNPGRPATASASPAPATAPAAAAPADAAQVEAAVKAWAQAWSRRDVAAYTGAYVADFRGSAADADAWRAETRARLQARSRIVIRISELEVSVDGDRAQARFHQNYESDTPDSRRRTRKTLELQRVQGRWLIREEVLR